MEVLARAVHPVLGVQLLAAGPVAGQLGEVGEQVEQVDLAADHVVPAGAGLLAGGEVAGQGGRLGVARRRRSRAGSRSGRRARGPRARRRCRRARAPAARGPGRSASAASAPSPASATGSRRTSGAPVSTWLPVDTSSSRTRPANGACSTVSIFMDSSTSTGAPAATSSPTATGVATTRAGAGERSTPPSSRLTRWVTPSTSTSCTGPWVAVTRRNRCAADGQRLWYSSSEVDLGLDHLLVVAVGDRDAVAGRADLQHGDLVRRTPQLEVDGAPDLVLDLRAAAAGGLEEVLVSRPPRPRRRRSRRRPARRPECRWATSRPSARTRSIQPVSARCRRSPRAGRAGRGRSSCWWRRPR